MMNTQMLGRLTFNAAVSVPFADGRSEFFCPLVCIRDETDTTLPSWRVWPTHELALPNILAIATTKPLCVVAERNNPYSLIADRAVDVFASVTAFLPAFLAATYRLRALLFDLEFLSAYFADAPFGIVVFGQSAFPATQPSPILELSRGDIKLFAAPSTIDAEPSSLANLRTLFGAISVLLSRFACGVSGICLPAGFANVFLRAFTLLCMIAFSATVVPSLMRVIKCLAASGADIFHLSPASTWRSQYNPLYHFCQGGTYA